MILLQVSLEKLMVVHRQGSRDSDMFTLKIFPLSNFQLEYLPQEIWADEGDARADQEELGGVQARQY